MAILLALALSAYAVARGYSPALIYYVVEQSLVQKAPAGVSAAEVRKRLQAHISAVPDPDARTRLLLQISTYLEKVQHLAGEEWNRLLPPEKPGASPVS